MHHINITFDAYNFVRINDLVITQLKLEVSMKISYYTGKYAPEADGGIRMRGIGKGTFNKRFKNDNSRNGFGQT